MQGTVNVGNFPATQPVSGSVNVNNFPTTQPISGSVSITGTPNVNVANTVPVSGSVSITGTPNVSVTNNTTTILLSETIENDTFSTILDTSNCSTIRISFYAAGPDGAAVVYDASTQAGLWGPDVCRLSSTDTQVITTPPPSVNIVVGTGGVGPNYITVYCR